MTTPVFLVAARRSGTTLFRLMLGGHQQVHFQHRWEDVAAGYRALEAGAASVVVEIEDIDPIVATSVGDLRSKIEAELSRLLSAQEATFLGATCHIDFLALHKMWPDAKFIHLLRDPRDVAISYRKLGWAGHDYFAADGWITAERDWDILSRDLQPSQSHTIRYEDLVLDPEAELTKLCAFLGIPYTQDLFSYTETSPYSYPKKELANRWRDQLSPDRLALVESRMRSLMTERGYAPSESPMSCSNWQVRIYGIRDALTKRLIRVRRNGIYFVAINMMARRFPLGVLKRHAAALQAKRHTKHVSGLEKGY